MNPNIIPSFNSISKFSKLNEDYNSSITMNTINPNVACLSFRVKFETKFGEELYIIGNIEELGEWDTSKAVKMETNKSIYPMWVIKKDFKCPLGMEIDYKYLVKDGNKIFWEDLGQARNRHIVVQSPGNLIIFDEQSNIISTIKTSGFIQMGSCNLSNTDYLLIQNLINETSQKQNTFINNNEKNNNIILSSILNSNQSLSSFQKESEYSFKENEEDNNNFENFSSKDNDFIEDEDKISPDNFKENFSQFDILNICQGIKPEDKIVIVTSFLPFILDIKDNFISNDIDNNDNLSISENKNDLNNKYKIILYDDKLVNLILYKLKDMNFCKVYWVGMLPGINDYPEDLQFEISEFLQNKNIYIILPKKNDFFNYHMFINKILNPIYNDSSVDISSYFIMNKDNYYIGYNNINKNFADAIISIQDKEQKMILINDIDLALVPSYLLSELEKNKLLKKDFYRHLNKNNQSIINNICFTFNKNIPDYNILSLMNINKDLLQSILLCDSLGFHSFLQAKNFLNAIKMYFDANYKVRFNGEITIEYSKREIPLFIRNIHIKVESIKNLYKNYSDKEKKNSNQNNKIINMLSIDSISNFNDIFNKINIFNELNKSKYLGYNYKLELIVEKNRYVDSFLISENEKYQKVINDKIKVIKESFGPDFNSLFQITFIDFMNVKEQIKYFLNADIFLFSDINIWNGMKPLMQEFIIVQDELISNKSDKSDENINNKIVGLIVNENMVIQEDLKLIKKANFYDINSIKNILKEFIEMSLKERINILKNDCNQLQKSSTIEWIKDLLCQLKKILINNKNKERIGEGYGKDFSYYYISKSFTRLNQSKFQILLEESNHKLFLLNIKSIFPGLKSSFTESKKFENDFDISDSYIDNNKKLVNILNQLSKDNNYKICLITNESKDIFKDLNLNLNNFYLIAEDGLVIKSKGEQNFKNKLILPDNNWKNPIIKIIKNFIKKTGTGDLIINEFSIVWKCENYKNGEYLIGNELKFLVEKFIDDKTFDINLQKNILEIKLKNSNNIKYNYINDIINDDKNLKLIFALNESDKKGDEFFEYLYHNEIFNQNNLDNINLFTAIIGKKPSKAHYYLKDIYDFINLFNTNNFLIN